MGIGCRVLWLSNETPDRHGQGGQRRQFFQIAALAKAGVDITVVTLAGSQSDNSIRGISHVQRTSPWLFRGVPSPRHWLLLRRLGRLPWDRIIIAHTESWPTWQPLLRALGSDNTLLDMHNVLSAWHVSQARAAEAASWRLAEDEIAASGCSVAVCSTKEAALLKWRIPPIVLPHGIDPAEWGTPRSPASRPVVKLFGNWAWAPNAEGLRWFVESVWPRLDGDTGWMCEIAGSDVPQSLPSGVRAVGRVASLSAFLANATLVAVPVREGVGAPVKYAEALASGAPVLATCDGAPYLKSLPACVSDEPNRWAQVMSDVCAFPAHYEELARHARDTVLATHTWDSVLDPLVTWVTHARTASETAPAAPTRPRSLPRDDTT